MVEAFHDAEGRLKQRAVATLGRLDQLDGQLESVFAGLLRPLVDQELAVVLYDMTTIRTEGLSQQPNDRCQFGMVKEGLNDRQAMQGFVKMAKGLPHFVIQKSIADSHYTPILDHIQ